MTINVTVYPTADNETLCTKGQTTPAGDLVTLTDVVTKSAWSPGTFKGNYRNNSNFLSCDVIALDIDGGCSLADAVNKYFADYQYLIYTSKNHQKEKSGRIQDRFRVVLPLERPILTAAEYSATWSALHKQFPFIDKQAKDPARFFFPGTHYSTKTSGKSVSPVSCLHPKTIEFLAHGAEEGWNAALFRAAKDMQEQLYTEEQAIELLGRTPGQLGYLDPTDLRTIKSAFSKPPKYPPRTQANLADVDSEGRVQVNMEDLCRGIIDPNFIQHVSLDTTVVYKIEDPITKQVSRCSNPDVLKRHVAQELEQLFKQGALPKEVRTKRLLSPEGILKYWNTRGTAENVAPAAFGWLNDDNWAIKRLLFTPTKSTHPAWDSFLNRLSDKGAFMAWVWSCFESRSRSRQAVWLYGPSAQDGKSTVLRVLASCFGNAAASVNNTMINSKSQFTLSNFYNRRIVLYPDAKNTSFPMTELFRVLTSGDVVPIEFKGEGTINCVLYVKLIVASNMEPSLTLSNADRSRLIQINVEESENKDDPTWEEKLMDELPAFLYSARSEYGRLCPHHGQIELSELSKQLLIGSAEELTENYQRIFEHVFEKDEEGTVNAGEFYDIMLSRLGTSVNVSRFKQYLFEALGVRRSQSASGKRIYKGIKLKQQQRIFPRIVS